MDFKYEKLPIEGKEILREEILRLFDRDIMQVLCSFSSRNYAFIFPDGCHPAILRVSVETAHKTTASILTELMWVDDLRNDVPTVCQPIPSREHKLVERISVLGKTYLVCMFRKANGAKMHADGWTPEFYYRAAELLGKIHRSSSEGYERGFRYKRAQWDEDPTYAFEKLEPPFPADILADAITVRERIKSMPKDPRWFGMVHGDYNFFNLFYDWDTVWAFDFDDSCYGYFMQDVGTLVHLFVSHGGSVGRFRPETIQEDLYGENGIYENVKKGYSSQWQLPEEQWDMLEDFMRLRTGQTVMQCYIGKLFPPEISIALQRVTEQYIKLDASISSRAHAARNARIEAFTPDVQARLAKFMGE